ncbi:hypothetical protein [Streptomyces iconiensis]|uniref:Uncharacterized protein n=1 Tax=Streptomyces iconiensis TaxID=1384038 RepID=A0ABT7A6Y1_9ACTN|nr:hypothetical protein [Streptomyces iconiensis]MDJ1137069.1 hypothetical protein [Streptomyces iconiensis]
MGVDGHGARGAHGAGETGGAGGSATGAEAGDIVADATRATTRPYGREWVGTVLSVYVDVPLNPPGRAYRVRAADHFEWTTTAVRAATDAESERHRATTTNKANPHRATPATARPAEGHRS